MTPGPIFVAAGSFGDFHRWCQRTGVREPWVRYLAEPDDLRVHEDILLVVVDGGWARLQEPRMQMAVSHKQQRGQIRVETAATEPPARAA